jgi:Ca2+-binding EF-hand superfamily protein
MGASASITPGAGSTEEDIQFLKTNLRLTDGDVKKFWKLFRKFDMRDDGGVEYDEFRCRLKCEKGAFLEQFFLYFSSSNGCDRKRTMKFAEFVLAMCYFLIQNEMGITQLLYKILVDETRRNCVTIEELEEAMSRMFGNGGVSAHKRERFLGKLISKKGVVYENDFVGIVASNKSLTFPLIALQIDLKRKVSRSERFWSKYAVNIAIISPRIDALRHELGVILQREATSEERLHNRLLHGDDDSTDDEHEEEKVVPVTTDAAPAPSTRRKSMTQCKAESDAYSYSIEVERESVRRVSFQKSAPGSRRASGQVTEVDSVRRTTTVRRPSHGVHGDELSNPTSSRRRSSVEIENIDDASPSILSIAAEASALALSAAEERKSIASADGRRRSLGHLNGVSVPYTHEKRKRSIHLITAESLNAN